MLKRTIMERRTVFQLLGLSALALGGCSAQTANKPSSSSTPTVGPGITFYSGTGPANDLTDALAAPFAAYMKAKYGVAVKVNNVVGAVPNSWAALQTEWPNPSGDVYVLYNNQVAQGIKDGWWVNQRGGTAGYTDAEWAKFDPGYVKNLDAVVGADGYVVPQEISAYVLAVQDSVTNVTSWKDLGDARFKNRVTLDSALAVGSGYNPLAAASLVLGSDWTQWFQGDKFQADVARPTFELVGTWAKNALTLTQGSGSITPLLQRKEALVSAWWWHTTTQEKLKGTPIHVVYPTEGVPAIVSAGPVVSAKSKNPIAAMEWAKFFLSETAAQEAIKINELNRIPRTGDPVSPAFAEFQKNAKIVWIDQLNSDLLDPKYNKDVLALYNQVVIQGQ